MKRLLVIPIVAAAVSLTVLAAPQQGQSNKPAAKPTPPPTPEVTLLVATFRDDPGDLISSDGLGPYYGSSSRDGVAAEIDADGYLNFSPVREGRSVSLAFPPPIRQGAQALPDLTDEPVTSWSLSTCCRSLPSQNPSPLRMAPDDVWVYGVQTKMYTTTSSDTSGWYALRFNKTFSDPGLWNGRLQLTARDTDGDHLVDQWILEPLDPWNPDFRYEPNYMNLSRYIRKGGGDRVDYGDYIMPFQITFDAPGR
jgi:hypothetical protein